MTFDEPENFEDLEHFSSDSAMVPVVPICVDFKFVDKMPAAG